VVLDHQVQGRPLPAYRPRERNVIYFARNGSRLIL
jgi:hypothetical protein